MCKKFSPEWVLKRADACHFLAVGYMPNGGNRRTHLLGGGRPHTRFRGVGGFPSVTW